MAGQFTLTGPVTQLAKDGVDAGIAQDETALVGWTATLVCNIRADVGIPNGDGVAYIDERTITVLPNGQITENGTAAGISLTAHDPELFDDQVQWTVKPAAIALASGKTIRPKPWTFDAPAAGETLTLGDAKPVLAKGTPTVTRGPRGKQGDEGDPGPPGEVTTAALNAVRDQLRGTNPPATLDSIAELATAINNDPAYAATVTAALAALSQQLSTVDAAIRNDVTAALGGKQSTSARGQANGYAPLDAGGKLPAAMAPDIAVVDFLGVKASQVQMLASTGQKGDWCTRSDTGTDWQIIGDDPTQLASWRQMTYPASPVASVAGLTGVIAAAALKSALSLTKGDVGLGNVTNTADVDKPVSTAQAAADETRVPKALVDAKGDLLIGSANDVVSRLGVGADGQVLTARAAAALGLEWAAPAAGGGSGGGASSYVFTQNVGNGTAGPYTVTHNFGSTNIFVQVWKNAGAGLTSAAPNTLINATPTIVDANTIQFSPGEAWGSGEFRVIVTLVTAATAPSPVASLPLRGVYANLPAAGVNGRVYYCTDIDLVLFDNGTTWERVQYGSVGGAFVDVPTTGWTQFGLGTGHTLVADRDGRLLSSVSHNSGDALRGEHRAVSGNFTLRAYLEKNLNGQGPSNTNTGILLSDGTKFIHFGPALFWVAGSNFNWRSSVRCWLWNTATATASSLFEVSDATGTGFYTNCWWQIREDATTRYYETSSNGVDFSLLFSHAKTTHLTTTRAGHAMAPKADAAGFNNFQRLRSFQAA